MQKHSCASSKASNLQAHIGFAETVLTRGPFKVVACSVLQLYVALFWPMKSAEVRFAARRFRALMWMKTSRPRCEWSSFSRVRLAVAAEVKAKSLPCSGCSCLS